MKLKDLHLLLTKEAGEGHVGSLGLARTHHDLPDAHMLAGRTRAKLQEASKLLTWKQTG